jgi:hypothetical protein
MFLRQFRAQFDEIRLKEGFSARHMNEPVSLSTVEGIDDFSDIMSRVSCVSAEFP